MPQMLKLDHVMEKSIQLVSNVELTFEYFKCLLILKHKLCVNSVFLVFLDHF